MLTNTLIVFYVILTLGKGGNSILLKSRNNRIINIRINDTGLHHTIIQRITVCLPLLFMLNNVKFTKMKKVIFLTLIAVLGLGSCKSTKKSATTPYTPPTQQTAAPTAPPKVFTVPEKQETTPVKAEEKPVTMRKEAITFTQPEEQNQNSYFIIIGSFSSMENAKNFRQTLLSEGFTPIIVQSETGYYRVTVDSFAEETSARARLLDIRNTYPKYADTWLLIKK